MNENEPDEFHGQGGEYIVDAKTGKRRLVGRTQAPEEKQPEAPQPPARKKSAE